LQNDVGISHSRSKSPDISQKTGALSEREKLTDLEKITATPNRRQSADACALSINEYE
jgi:hypothetical protein